MKNKIIAFSLFLFLSSHYLTAQQEYLIKKNIEVSQEIITVLNNENIESKLFKDNLNRAVRDYCGFQYYAPGNASQIFELFWILRNKVRDDYYRFIIVNAHYFSEEQTAKIKSDLEETVGSISDSRFHLLVSIFHLDKFKEKLTHDLEDDLFVKIEEYFKRGSTVPRDYLEKSLAYTTLANLGDQTIEDSIILFVNEMYEFCNKEENSNMQESLYMSFFTGIVPKLLGKLHSKRSVIETRHMLQCDYTWKIDYIDVGTRPPADSYFYGVIGPKVSIYENSKYQMTFIKSKDEKAAKKEYIEDLIKRIETNQIEWKKTLIDFD
ncbi:MAG: hypothetical protein R2788_03830 [Saprospiraceae bacterium]